MTDERQLAHARELLRSATSVAVLTGAGISTDSGIPDFRGPDGVWTRDPEAERRSTISHYLAEPQTRVDAWRIRAGSEVLEAQPNAGHRALTALGERLHTMVTQNIDGLHHLAGTPTERLVEIHGTIRSWVCTDCGARGPMAEALDRVRAGEADPPCPVCGGIIKAATILFGESLVTADLQRAEAAAAQADVLLAIGTSLSVYPVANMVHIAAHHDRPVIIVNQGPTDLDHLAVVRLNGPASTILPTILGDVAENPT